MPRLHLRDSITNCRIKEKVAENLLCARLVNCTHPHCLFTSCHCSLLGILASLNPIQTMQMTGHLYLLIMMAAQHVWTTLESFFFHEAKEYAAEHRISPATYPRAVGHLVSPGLSFLPAWHFKEHHKIISPLRLSCKWTPPAHPCKGTSQTQALH